MTHSPSKRPLSPHLQVYKPQMTTVLSILHRATGFALSCGLIPLTIWLYYAAYDPIGLEDFYALAGGFIGIILLLGWSVAFYYHLANGIRHLIWDTGRLLEINAATRAGYFVLGTTLGLTACTWIYLLSSGAI